VSAETVSLKWYRLFAPIAFAASGTQMGSFAHYVDTWWMDIARLWSELETPWRICLELMWTAYAANTIPVGAGLADGQGNVVASGRNGVYANRESGIPQGSRFLHAEVNALAGLDVEGRLAPADTHPGRRTFGASRRDYAPCWSSIVVPNEGPATEGSVRLTPTGLAIGEGTNRQK
jgi:hypothetical protein